MLKIKCKSTFFCEYVVIGEKSQISLFGIFKNINTHNIPGVYLRLFFVAFLEFEKIEEKEQDLKLNLKIYEPTGEESEMKLPETTLKINPTQNSEPIVSMDILNFKFNQEGKYKFELIVNGEAISSSFLNIIKTK